MIRIKRLFLVLTFLAFALVSLAIKPGNGPIILVSSYNPDVRNMSDNIFAFSERAEDLQLNRTILVENLESQNLPDCKDWKRRMWSLLEKYYQDGKSPSAIILLGNEAVASYFSQDREVLKQTPVMMCMINSQILLLPENDSTDLSEWNPSTKNIQKDFKDYNIVGGSLLNYDFDANIDLIKQFYPDRDSLVFLSDNSFGGLTIRQAFSEAMVRHPEYNVEYLDGRRLTFQEVRDKLTNLSTHKVLIAGAWRADRTNRFVVKNSTQSLGECNPHLPMFTTSSIGMGHWSIGGCQPAYHTVGAELADDLAHYFKTGEVREFRRTDNHYLFDYNKLKQFNLPYKDLKLPFDLMNKTKSILDEYLWEIAGMFVLVFILAFSLACSLHFLHKSHVLGQQLQENNQKVEAERQKAEEASQTKSNFISNMSHEIRTPMNAVVGFSQILADPETELSPEERKEYGDIISTNSNLLLDLINDILEVSRFDAGRINFNFKEMDLVEVCYVATESAKADLRENLTIVSKFPTEPLMANTDMNRLLQVLGNLFSNAKKCTDEGQITITVGHTYPDSSTGQNMVQISIEDTGCGIPKDKAEVIFERFTKLNDFRQGTGLGLSLCRSIVEGLGGKIWVDTEYTRGARFVFTHPVLS